MDNAIQISKNFIKGDPIRSADQLIKLSYDKKSIYHYVYGIKPAAVIINMSFYQVIRMIEENKLYTIVKLVKLKTQK